VAADTIVVLDSRVLGKPAEATEARQMLRDLRGRDHHVLSSVTVLRRLDDAEITDWADSLVHMRDYSDAEADAYVVSGDPLDKAGAYAIQHPQFDPVAGMFGCYASVVGFPLCHIYRALRMLGVDDIAYPVPGCRVATGYLCTFYGRALAGAHGPY
jgi:septum formation protein